MIRKRVFWLSEETFKAGGNVEIPASGQNTKKTGKTLAIYYRKEKSPNIAGA